MHYKKYEAAKLYARELRKDSTPADVYKPLVVEQSKITRLVV
jgi:hypothetical protein